MLYFLHYLKPLQQLTLRPQSKNVTDESQAQAGYDKNKKVGYHVYVFKTKMFQFNKKSNSKCFKQKLIFFGCLCRGQQIVDATETRPRPTL